MSKVPRIKTKYSGIIVLDTHRDESGGGLLAVAQSAQADGFVLPIVGRDDVFRGVRFFSITDITRRDTVRANHAHRKTSEAIFCIQGSCTVHLDDGRTQQDIVLDDPSLGIITGPNLWHSITDFAPGTVLLALADGPYDPNEYIHNHEDFLREIADGRK